MLFLKTVRDWSDSAKSGLLSARQLNDRTEATLPDAETDHWSQPGPTLPVTSQRNSGSKNLGQVRMVIDDLGADPFTRVLFAALGQV
jgi:hypothetical protein